MYLKVAVIEFNETTNRIYSLPENNGDPHLPRKAECKIRSIEFELTLNVI